MAGTCRAQVVGWKIPEAALFNRGAAAAITARRVSRGGVDVATFPAVSRTEAFDPFVGEAADDHPIGKSKLCDRCAPVAPRSHRP